MGNAIYYLIAVNAAGLCLMVLNQFLSSHTKKNINLLLVLCSLAGGSAGILLSILLFDRKPEKENMLFRVCIACIFVMQTALLIYKRHHIEPITIAFWTFLGRHQLVLIYLVLINVLAFIMYAMDKVRAIKDRARIKIITLLGLAFIGGSIGSLLAVYLLRHKTRKAYFTIGIPVIMLMQAVVLFCAMNIQW